MRIIRRQSSRRLARLQACHLSQIVREHVEGQASFQSLSKKLTERSSRNMRTLEVKTNMRLICTHCTSRVEMMANVLKAFEEYPADKFDGIWACYYNNLRSVMQSDGGNDFKQAHNGGKRRRRETGSAIDLSINLDDYERCVRLAM